MEMEDNPRGRLPHRKTALLEEHLECNLHQRQLRFRIGVVYLTTWIHLVRLYSYWLSLEFIHQ